MINHLDLLLKFLCPYSRKGAMHSFEWGPSARTFARFAGRWKDRPEDGSRCRRGWSGNQNAMQNFAETTQRQPLADELIFHRIRKASCSETRSGCGGRAQNANPGNAHRDEHGPALERGLITAVPEPAADTSSVFRHLMARHLRNQTATVL